MDSEEDLSLNPWARYLGIDRIEYIENVEPSFKPKANVTRLNYEDMSLFGLCPVWEDLHLTLCKICESILKPQAFKSHMERRHGLNGMVSKHRKLSTECSTSKRRTITPSTTISSASSSLSNPPAKCSTASAASSITSVPCSSASVTINNTFPVHSGASIASSSLTTTNINPPSLEPRSAWLFGGNNINGAIQQQQQQSSNVSVNIVRVKPENSKPKITPTASYTKVDSSLNSMSMTIPSKKIVSHKKELPSSQELMLPELSSSVIPSASNRVLSPLESKPSENFNEYCSALQSSQPSSTSLPESTPDNSEASEEGKKTPALEKLVLRRVLQTGPNTSAVRRPTLQKGMKGVARNKKDSIQETYFMVVKDKDRQHNLLAARHQLRKQSDVVHQEKDKVEQKMKKLESVRNKLISQLFQELQAVKQKLHQCNISKSELHKELLAVRGQLEEARRTTELQTEALSKQNSEYRKEIQDLKEKIDLLTASTSSFMEQQQMANQACKVRQYAAIITQLKRRLDAQVTQNEELKTQKDMLEKHLPADIRFQVKSQLANFQMQQEIYPGLNINESSIPSPAVPFAEKYLTDLRNIEYCAFQHQMTND